MLAAFTPAAIPGLTIGCVLGNITSPLGIADIVFGAAATLLSAVAVRVIAKYCGKATPFLSVLPPTVINAVIVGAEIVYLTSPEGSLSAALFGRPRSALRQESWLLRQHSASRFTIAWKE
mgnify:FL=1